jgi:ATP synthase proteolipid subunit
MVFAIARGVAALALVALAESAESCDSSALVKCTSQHSRPYLPKGANSQAVAGVCKSASAYYECVAESGCLSSSVAKECAADFDLAHCDGVSVCKPELPKPSPAAKGGEEAPASPPGLLDEDEFDYEKYPPHAAFFGYIGATAALVFANLGAAYGTAKSGRGISTMGVVYPALVMKHIIPVVMAGVLGIYGLIIAVIIGNGVQTTKNDMPNYPGTLANRARAPPLPPTLRRLRATEWAGRQAGS